MWFKQAAPQQTVTTRQVTASSIAYLRDAIIVALGEGYAAQVREVCAQTISMIDRYEPGLEIHTADTLPSIVAARSEE